MALNDKLRAAVFARDKGICAFSGLSLWLLNLGTPFARMDWADHVRPAARGGKDSVDNLVCASDFHNAKKRHNGADNLYLFAEGVPTEHFYWLHGELTAEQADVIRRQACLTVHDWYFNRALMSLFIALDVKWRRSKPVRGSDYWLRSANKKLNLWRRIVSDADPESFVRRGLVRFPESPDIILMLESASADEDRLAAIYRELSRYFGANSDCIHRFAGALSPEDRARILHRARENQYVTPPVLTMLETNLERMA